MTPADSLVLMHEISRASRLRGRWVRVEWSIRFDRTKDRCRLACGHHVLVRRPVAEDHYCRECR